MLPGESPESVVQRAVTLNDPIARWCLFSGGNDSTVLAHRCAEHYEGLAWIDTGLALPGVAEFVAEFARWIDKPLRVLHAGNRYEDLVCGDNRWWERMAECRDLYGAWWSIEDMREWNKSTWGQEAGVVKRGPQKGLDLGQFPHGFPTGATHGRTQNRLKQRQIEAFVRDLKTGHPRTARVLFLTGIRRAESKQREKYAAITREGGAAYANPLIDWKDHDMRRYRAAHAIPESDAAAIMHRSGECNCGAHANARDEAALLRSVYRDWWDAVIAPIEAKAERLGVRWCRYGGYDLDGNRATEKDDGESLGLCQDCPTRLFDVEPVAA